MAKPAKTPKDPVVADLQEIAVLAQWFELDVIDATPENGRNTGKPRSRPPVDLTVISDLDECWNCLTTWCRDWCETFSYSGPQKATWDGVTGWLERHWLRTRTEHLAPEVFAQEVHDHLRTLRHHQGSVHAWKPLPGRWTCPVQLDDDTTCGGKLNEHIRERRIVCSGCGSTWVGEQQYASLGRLLKVEPFVTLEQAAYLQRVSVRTVQRWIAKDLLPAHRRDGVVVVDRLDLALAKDRA